MAQSSSHLFKRQLDDVKSDDDAELGRCDSEEGGEDKSAGDRETSFDSEEEEEGMERQHSDENNSDRNKKDAEYDAEESDEEDIIDFTQTFPVPPLTPYANSS